MSLWNQSDVCSIHLIDSAIPLHIKSYLNVTPKNFKGKADGPTLLECSCDHIIDTTAIICILPIQHFLFLLKMYFFRL